MPSTGLRDLTGTNAFDGKPVAIMGASIGTLGTARAQYDLRRSFVFLNMLPLNQPEVMVSLAQDKVDGNGRVTDGVTRKKIVELLQNLAAWTRRIRFGEEATGKFQLAA